MNVLAQALKDIIPVIAMSLLLAFPEHASAADPFAEAARELANKIVTDIGPLESVGFTFQTITSLGPREIAAARQAIENELRAQGLRFAADSQTTVKVQVTLSENYRQFIWIAEIRGDQRQDLLMTTQIHSPIPSSKEAALRMAVQARQIYEQNDPVLDLKLLNEELLVLDPDQLTLYHRSNDQWEIEHAVPIKGQGLMARDPRGRLSDAGDTIRIHLPGLSCNGTIKPALGLECSQQDSPWPLPIENVNLAPGWNYFVRDGLPDFFSASSVKEDGTDLWIVAGVDGHTYLLDRSMAKVGTVEGWGNDIASIDSGCGTGRQILATLPRDPLERGAIQAFEIVNHRAVVASSSVEFPGPITALWPVINQNAAIAVSRDLKTGRYAAFHLSISCGR